MKEILAAALSNFPVFPIHPREQGGRATSRILQSFCHKTRVLLLPYFYGFLFDIFSCHFKSVLQRKNREEKNAFFTWLWKIESILFWN